MHLCEIRYSVFETTTLKCLQIITRQNGTDEGHQDTDLNGQTSVATWPTDKLSTSYITVHTRRGQVASLGGTTTWHHYEVVPVTMAHMAGATTILQFVKISLY